jgi:hypothetical protein
MAKYNLSKKEAKAQGVARVKTSKSSSKSGTSKSSGSINPNIGGKFKFDTKGATKAYEQQASQIYDPQIAQINAMRSLSSSDLGRAEVTNRKELGQRLTSEIESINKRGAFFSGGALTRESNIRDTYDQNLADTRSQFQMKDLGYQGQQGQLMTDKSNYIQNMVSGASNSAYSRWKDNRDFLFRVADTNYTNQTNAQNTAFDQSYKLASLNKSGGSGGGGTSSDAFRAAAMTDISNAIDPKTGYADANKYRSALLNYYSATGKQLSTGSTRGLISPTDPMRQALFSGTYQDDNGGGG